MTLIDLLTVMSFFMPIAGAITEAKGTRAQAGGYVLACLLGAIAGIAVAWGHRAGCLALATHLEKSGKAVQGLGTVFYLIGCFVWLVLGDVTGFWIAKPVLHLLPG
jgi:hypothetical protein